MPLEYSDNVLHDPLAQRHEDQNLCALAHLLRVSQSSPAQRHDMTPINATDKGCRAPTPNLPESVPVTKGNKAEPHCPKAAM